MKGSRVVAVGVLLAALIAVLAFAGAATAKKPRTADTVFKNGYVYTVNPGQRTAHAVAVRSGKIQYVGSNRGVRAFIGRKTEVVDLKGKMLMPSFADGHAHPSAAVSFLYAANLYGAEAATTAEYKVVLADFIAANPTLEAYQGSGWSEAAYPGIGPLKADLEGLTTKPMSLWSDGHHSLWVNQAALDLAGIDNTTANPIGGVIERVPGSVATDPPYGMPSGCLRESATDMMMAVFPDFTVEQYKEGILFYQQAIANPVGITLSQDAVQFPGVQQREGVRGTGAGRRADGAHPRVAAAHAEHGRRRATGRRDRGREGVAQDDLLQDHRRQVLRRRRDRRPHRLPARALCRRARLQGRRRLPGRSDLAAHRLQRRCHEGRQGRHADPRARDRRRRREREPRRDRLRRGRERQAQPPADDHPPATGGRQRLRALQESRRDSAAAAVLVPDGRLLPLPPGAVPRPAARRRRVPDEELLRPGRARGLGQRLPGHPRPERARGDADRCDALVSGVVHGRHDPARRHPVAGRSA